MEIALPSEKDLAERAVKGDRGAFSALYDRYVERVYRHVYYWVPSQPDAEDITQEVFVKAWKAISAYRVTGAPFVSWLTAIARNLIADHYRARKRLKILESESAAPAGDDPETLVEAKFAREDIREAILKLSQEKQKVIIMRFIQGFDHAEVATALQKSEGAVRVIQYRALQELRRILENKERNR